jgi:hypothetical protein
VARWKGFLALVGAVAGVVSAWIAWKQHRREPAGHAVQTRTRTAGSRAFDRSSRVRAAAVEAAPARQYVLVRRFADRESD